MEIYYYETLPSTNRTAYEAARDGAGEFYTVAAKEQTAGRGRLERSFLSPRGGTYFSVVLRPTFPIGDYGRITPFAAVAVHRAIVRTVGLSPKIKWVNDLLLEGKKICGILAESGTDKNGKPFVILGIGINTGRGELPREIAEIAARLPFDDPATLIGAVLSELSDYEQEIKNGFWHGYYRLHAAFLGEPVRVIDGKGERMGILRDILPDGGIRVLFFSGEEESLYGGEISLRPAQIDEI